MSDDEYGSDALDWPRADLDPIRRLRVLAAAAPFPVAFEEIVVPAPFEVVWAVASDLEHELPRSLVSVRTANLTRADGEDLELICTGWLGQRARFDVVLRPGWCVMRSRFVLGGMAAMRIPEGEQGAGGTRFASLGGFKLPGMRLAKPGLELMSRRSVARFRAHPSFAAPVS
jgi:hypothetical protein